MPNAEAPTVGTPVWFEPAHADDDGDDPWFMIRFSAVPPPGAKRELLATSRLGAVGECVSAQIAGRDLHLDFSDADVHNFKGGYAAFLKGLDKLIAALHQIHPVFMVFRQPNDAVLAMSDDALLALHHTPKETVALYVAGDLAQRLIAAQRAARLLPKFPDDVAALLCDPAEEVRAEARAAIRNYYLWRVRRMKTDKDIKVALRMLRFDAIREAASYGVAMLVRDETFAGLVAAVAGEPGQSEAIQKLLAAWQGAPRQPYERGIGTFQYAALAVLSHLQRWAEVQRLAESSLGDCTDPTSDDRKDIYWVEDLLGRSRRAQRSVATPRKVNIATGTSTIAECEVGTKVTVEGTVVMLGAHKVVRKSAGRTTIVEGQLQDESGRISFELKDEQSDGVCVGHVLRFSGARVSKHAMTHRPQLSIDDDGSIEIRLA